MNKRMAGDYEIIQSFHIGDQEVVLGENVNAPPEERYMCAFCQQNEIMALYNDVLVSDDFCEIAKLYGERLAQQAEKTRVAMFKPKFQGSRLHVRLGNPRRRSQELRRSRYPHPPQSERP